MAEWDQYVRRTSACVLCQKGFEEQELYHATLCRAEQGFERRDYCQGCWTDEFHQRAFSYWQARIPKKEEKKKLFVDDAVLVDFFRRLAEDQDETRDGFFFVLMLILMRKRILKYLCTDQTESGVEIWRMKLTGGDKEFKVPNPHLDDEQIEQIRTELNQVLSGD